MNIADKRTTVRDSDIYYRVQPPSTTRNYVANFDVTKTSNFIDRTIGEPVVNYRDKIATGTSASSAYSRSFTLEWSPAFFSSKSINSISKEESIRRIVSATVTSIPGGMDVTDSTLQSIAVHKVKDKLRNANSNYQAAVPLAELSELRSTIRSSANLTIGFLNRLRDLKDTVRNPKQQWRYAQDFWLNYSFGINPLVGEAKAIAEAIAAYQLKADATIHVHGSAEKEELSSLDLGVGEYACDGYYYTGKRTIQTKLSYRVKGGFRPLITSSNNYGATEWFGISASQLFVSLPIVLWELTPYSWIVDYFSNVGQFLEDSFQSPGNNTIYLVSTRRYEVKVVDQWQPALSGGIPGWKLQNISSGFSTLHRVKYDRTVLGALPYPSLRLKTTDEVGTFAVKKVLNLASLLKVR